MIYRNNYISQDMKKTTQDAGTAGEKSEFIIMTHEAAEAMVNRIVDIVMQRVANFDNGTWKTLNETPGTRMSLTVDEMAKELNMSKTTAYDLVKQEGFPAFHIGRKVLVNRKGLQRWMDEGGTENVKAC